MKNLLRAEFTRMFKNKFVWLSFLVIIVLAFVNSYKWFSQIDPAYMFDEYRQFNGISSWWYNNVICRTVERVFTVWVQIIMMLLIGVFVSFFIGTEFTDKTVRNKLVCGCGRLKIYFSYLCVCVMYSLLLCGSFLMTSILTAVTFSHTLGREIVDVLVYFSAFAMPAAAAISAILVLTALIVRSKRRGVPVVILAVLILFAVNYLSGMVFSTLFTVPYDENGEIFYDENGEQMWFPNPNRSSDTVYKISSVFSRINPASQLVGINHFIWLSAHDEHYYFYGLLEYFPDLKFYPLYSLLWIAVSAGGCVVLSKRDNVS